MICKWCGSKMNPSARNCPACGAEAPRFSDCGGFYDIVPTAARSRTEPVEQPQVQNVRNVPPERPAPVKQESRQEAKKHALLPILSIGLTLIFGIVMLVSMLFMMRRIGALETSLEQMASERIAAEQETYAETASEVQTEELTEAVPEEKNIVYDAIAPEEIGKVSERKDGYILHKERNSQSVIKAVCRTEDGIEVWHAQMSEGPEDGMRTILCKYMVEPEQVGEYKSAAFVWQIWTSENGWKEISEDDEDEELLIEQGEDGQTSYLRIPEEWLARNVSEEGIRVRCTITRFNQDDDSIQIELGEVILAPEFDNTETSTYYENY